MKLDYKISELWNRLGYHNNQLNGACHGFIIRWIEACLLGQSYQFEQRKRLILELDIESFVIASQRIKEKNKSNMSLSHVAMTRLLLNCEADPNIFNSVGDSPLAMAAQGGYLEIVNWLIEAKAILDKQNSYGATALSLAVGGNHIAMVEKLIQVGANVNIPNHRGITPLQKAVALNYPVVATLLKIEISRNHTGLKKAIIPDHLSHGFFGLKNQSGDPTELDIRRHFRGYS